MWLPRATFGYQATWMPLNELPRTEHRLTGSVEWLVSGSMVGKHTKLQVCEMVPLSDSEMASAFLYIRLCRSGSALLIHMIDTKVIAPALRTYCSWDVIVNINS